MKKIYLDYAAGTPLAPEVTKVVEKYTGQYHNPSAIYLSARESAEVIERSRKVIADILGAKPAEIIFTSGATEADNLAIGGVLKAHPGARVAIAASEHKAVSQAAEAYSGLKVDIIKVDKTGLVTPAALKRAIKPKTALISIAYADSEIGTIQNFRELLPVVEEARRGRNAKSLPLYLHTDASQAANYLDLHVSRLGVDLLSLGGAKIYGPKSSGALYVRHNVKLEPLIYGGGQERGLRSGSEDIAAIAGLAEALKLVQSDRVRESRRLSQFKDQLKRGLMANKSISFNGHPKRHLPNILNFSLAGADGERLAMKLDELGLEVGTGAACSLNSDQPSPVLTAIGLKPDQANSSLRLSLGRPTTEADVAKAVKILHKVLSA